MMHDFLITERSTILFDCAVTISASGIAVDREVPARIGVLPRFGTAGQVQWYPCAPGWVFHLSNAWEGPGGLEIVAARYPDYPDRPGVHPLLHRWTMRPEGGLEERGLADIPVEFPTIDERFRGQPLRHTFWALQGGMNQHGLARCDAGGSMTILTFPERVFGGEFVFVPRHPGAAESDGYLVGYVHDEGRDRSELWLVDTLALQDGPVARVRLPQRVPYGFHGAWIDARP